MEKNTNEILAQIQSELQELKKKAGELESRISGIADSVGAGPAETSVTSDPTGASEPAGHSEPAEAGVEEAFDIMMGDEVDLIQPAAPVGDEPDSAVNPEPESQASEAGTSQTSEQATGARTERKQEYGKKIEKTPGSVQKKESVTVPGSGRGKEESVQGNLLMEEEPRENAAKAVKKTKKPSKPVTQPTMFYAWQTDTPASPLSNILSGISLKDRALVIGVLFQDDAQLFIDTVSKFNRMRSLNEAESYIRKKFPRWKLDSDPVYKLMMAVRRKLN